MEDMLLIQLLKKKGIISDKDMHEFHELASVNVAEEPIYLSKSKYGTDHHDNSHMGEAEAKDIVSKMYHVEGGRKYVGEKFDMHKAKEVCERYRGLIPTSITVCDIYVAINSQYHDYYGLFKSWFMEGIEQRIIESAMIYWFTDDDCKVENKVVKYFRGY